MSLLRPGVFKQHKPFKLDPDISFLDYYGNEEPQEIQDMLIQETMILPLLGACVPLPTPGMAMYPTHGS